MNNYIVKLPVDCINEAVDVFRETHVKYQTIYAALPANEDEARELYGSRGVEEYKANKAKADAERAATQAQALDKLKTIWDEYSADVLKQITPNGNDLTGDSTADYTLLEKGLVTTPEQLADIVQRHNNPTFRELAKRYAATKKWDGFSFVDKSNTVLEYGHSFIMDNCAKACEDPGSYWGLLVADTNEPTRRAEAMGIMSEYAAGK